MFHCNATVVVVTPGIRQQSRRALALSSRALLTFRRHFRAARRVYCGGVRRRGETPSPGVTAAGPIAVSELGKRTVLDFLGGGRGTTMPPRAH